MGVDHRCLDVAVPEKFLYRPDVRARFQQMRREAVAKGVAANRLGDSDAEGRRLYRPLKCRLMKMVTP
jgi:hypothetical protein